MTTRRNIPLVGLVLAVAAVAAAAAASGLATAYHPLPSTVTVEGTSTLHDWKVASNRIDGEVEVPEGFLAGDTGQLPKVRVTIPVLALESGKAKMDKLMHEALAADRHRAIEYHLAAATIRSGAGSQRVVLDTRGRLTIAGRSREVAMEVVVTRQAEGRLLVQGSIPITMTDFGIDPPTAMLGTIKTGDDVTVGFEWKLGPPASAPPGAGR
jgi:polyisoprenoid-binding protein YceI